MIKQIFSKLIIRLLTQLAPILKVRIALHWIENVEQNVDRDRLTKFHAPYTILQSKIGKGTYIYKVLVKSQNQEKCKGTASLVEKLVILK